MLSKLIRRFAAVLLALLVWQALACYINESVLLVSPIQVLRRLFELLREKPYYSAAFLTVFRVIRGFFAGFFLGAVLALLAGRFKTVETLLWPYMITIKSVPVASFIVIALIWLASSRLPSFISFLVVLPVVYTNILEGMKSTDKSLLQTAKLFGLSGGKRLLYIYLPQLKPHVISASSVGAGFACKSSVAAEVIAMTEGSVGEMLYNAKINFETADLFAWTLTIVLLSVAFEKLLVFALKKGFKAVEKL